MFYYITSLVAYPEFRLLQTASPVGVLPSPYCFGVLFPFHISFKTEHHIANKKMKILKAKISHILAMYVTGHFPNHPGKNKRP